MRYSINGRHVLPVLFLMCLACYAPTPQAAPKPLPISNWSGNYRFSWTPPQESEGAAPASLTVCVVRPYYGDEDSTLARREFRKLAKGFAKSMGVDLDRVLVTKGIPVSGPFATYDDITYPEKKAADLALTPQVFIIAETKVGKQVFNGTHFETPVTMTIQGHIAFELREPLSKQKLWVKKLDLEPTDVVGLLCHEATPQWDQYRGHYHTPADLAYDGRQDAIADYFESNYPIIMQKAWVYLNVEEMTAMLADVKEIRDMKRY